MAVFSTLNANIGGDLGDVQSERHSKSAQLFQMPLPGSNSSDALLLDIMGVMRTISTESVLKDTVANIKTFITTMENTIAGTQTGIVFTSSIRTGTLNVLIDNFEWNYSAGEPTILRFTLNMIEGGI